MQIFLVLDSVTAKRDNVFFAGNINHWKPDDSSYRFKNGKLSIIANPGDILNYKITAGSWEKVEVSKEGRDVQNRRLIVSRDTTIKIIIAAFKYPGFVYVRKHTATEQVRIMDTAFPIPQLHRSRTVRIYLPPGYDKSNQRYPVLYITDGQNCFDEATSANGEWQIDEALNHFYDSCSKSLIVVAIDNGEALRIQEYSPYLFEMIREPQGKEFAAFLAETLKPYIDKHYRTNAASRDTHIAGSSLGAVISMYCLAAYPASFGDAGIFSPAFWTSVPLYEYVDSSASRLKKHSAFFYSGGAESKTMLADMKKMYDVFKKAKSVRTEMIIDETAGHNEAAWAKWFPVYLKFIFR